MENVTKKNIAPAGLIARRMKIVAKVRTYGQLGKILGGISSQAISGAIAKGKIPDRWFEIIEDRFGVGEDELCSRPNPRHSNSTNLWGEHNEIRSTTGNNSPTVTGHHIGEVTVTVGDQKETLELSPRELQLILRMRRYAPPALWEKLEQELLEQEQKYG